MKHLLHPLGYIAYNLKILTRRTELENESSTEEDPGFKSNIKKTFQNVHNSHLVSQIIQHFSFVRWLKYVARWYG